MPKNLHQIRKQYASSKLDETLMPSNPFRLLETWLDEAITAGVQEPTAMNLATAGKDAKPSSRIVLLKEISEKGLSFFTNYQSRKGIHLNENPFAAITFFWPELERQVRLEGGVKKLPDAASEKYFLSRPVESQIGAWASEQSKPLANREVLEEKFKKMADELAQSGMKRPDFWGGFLFEPALIEFWQGRPNRLHDRLIYTLENNAWKTMRLYP